MRPINVLHLRDTNEIGGPGKTILETFRCIDARRFRLHLGLFLTRHERGETPFANAARDAGMPIHFLRGFNQYDPRLVWRVARLVQDLHIDIVHAHEAKSDVIAWLAGGLHDARTMTTLHGWIGNSRKARALIGLDRLVVRGFDRVVVVSHSIRDQICSSGVAPDNVRVLHNAIVLDRYPPATRDERPLVQLLGGPVEPPILASIGRLSREKGHADLISALARLADRGCRFTAVLAGDGPERHALTARVSASGLACRVHLPGYVADPRVILNAADILVLPSHTEGLPNAALEAMAMQVPVLATAVGGTPEVIDHGLTGRLVPPASPEALASALADFFDNPGPWMEAARRAREAVRERFSFDRRTRRLEDLYSELVQKEIAA